MENSTQTPSMAQGFTRGFLSSAASGALMSGIFYGLGGLLGIVPFAILPAALLVGSVGLFGGIMGAKRAGDAAKAQQATAQRQSAQQQRAREVTTMEPEIAEARNADAPARQHPSRIQEILDRGPSDAKDRAGAILAEREAAAAQQNQR